MCAGLGFATEGCVQLDKLLTDWMPLVALAEIVLLGALVSTIALRRSDARRARSRGK
jgi:hypothetical protein